MNASPSDQTERPPTGTRTPPAAHDRRRAWSRVGAVVLVTIAVLFGLRVVDIVLATRRAEHAERELAAEVDSLQREVTALRTAAADARTDAGVERWAREERGWAREGDHPVRVSLTPAPTPPSAAPTTHGSDAGILSRLRRWLAELRP